MADRYWKAGSTNWSATASWGSTPGGTGASIPTVSDDVYFFDNATVSSGGGTCRNLYIGLVTVTWSSITAMTIGASATAGTGTITVDGTLTHSGSATFLVYGDLTINGTLNQTTTTAGTITMSGARDCSIYQAGGALNKLTLSKSTNAVNVYLNSTLYVNYTKTSANGVFTHTQGYLRQQGCEIYCTIFTSASGRNHDMDNNIVVFCQTSGATTITYVAPTTLGSRAGSFITRGFTVPTTVSMGVGTAAATAPNLSIEDNITVTSSGNVYSLQCDGTMSGSLTVFTSFYGNNRNNNMAAFTLTYGVTAAGESRDFSWTGTISGLTFTPTNGSATQTGCTYNINYARASGVITASSNSTSYYFNDVQWTASTAQCNGASSYYAFGNNAETKWTTGGLTCSGNASTYDFNNLNPTGASTLTCSATTAVSGTSATYNYNYVRGTAALAITINGLGTNTHNIGNVNILGNFTFNVSTLNLNDQWLYVLGFLTSSSSSRTINFNDRRIVTSGTGAWDSTTITNFSHNRGGYDSGGVQLGGSGSNIFGAATTTQSLRIWIERSGGTVTISSGNVRSIALNNGTLTGTVTINVDNFYTETGSGIASSALNLTMSSTTYNQWDYTYTSFGTVTFTGVAVWTIYNITTTNLACNANAATFMLYGYCNVTTAVTLTGTGSTFWLYNVKGSTLTATSGSNNNYRFEFTDGYGTDRGFSTSMLLGTNTSTGSQYTLVYVHQTGYISCQGSSGFSTYDFYDVRISNATTGVTFNTRGNFNLYSDLYTGQFNMGTSDGFARALNFNPDGSYSRNIYVSANSGSTCLNISNLSVLTISGRGDQDSGIIIVNNWFGTGAGSITLATSGIATNGANVPSIRIDGVKPSVGTGSVYHFKTFRGTFDTAGGVSNTGQTITVYGNLYISDTPFFGYGSIGVNTFVSTNFTLGRTDSTVQTIQTASDQGYGNQSLRIGTLLFSGSNTLQLAGYTQVTVLTFANGTIDLNSNQLYVQTSVTVSNNANQKYLNLNAADIYLNATTGAVWTCTDTNNVTCTGSGTVQVRGGTVNSGGTTRKYTDQVNFYLTGEAAYTLTSPFTCRNLVTNNYTPPASWTLYVGGTLTWQWSGAWTAPTGTVNFFATNATAYVSSNQGLNSSYSLPTINVQNGCNLNVSGAEVTFGTLNCTGNSTFRLLLGNAYCLTLLSIASGSSLDISVGTLVLGGSGGTQTTSGLYMASGSSLVNLNGTISFNGSGEKYLTLPSGGTISTLQNGGAFNTGTLTGYLNMYESFTVSTISNTVNPSGFRQQTAGSTISVGTFSVSGTSGARAYWRNPATANMIKTTAGNVSVDYIDVAFSTVTGNGSGQLWYAGANSVDSGNNSGWIFTAPPTYSLSISGGATTVNEGSSFTVVLTTTGVSNGTNVAYTISGSGITTGDIGGASLTGNFTISSGTASITFNVTADATTEGTESLTLALDNGQSSVSINILDTSATPTYALSISGGATTVNEGSSVTVILTTTNVADGTTVAYTLGGTISSADILGGSLSGNFTVSSNSASVTISIVADSLTEGSETLTLTLTGPGTNVSVTVLDTSTTPSGSPGNFLMFFPA